MESPIKIDDLGVSLCLETPKRLERYKPPNSFVDLNGATKMDLVKTSSIATIVIGIYCNMYDIIVYYSM